jgi:hypothetical protein
MSESGSVEVHRAEVRVLQVGDGQLTRSMYRQLDEAAPETFEPFGRVKDKKRMPKEWGQPKDGVLQLVGRDSRTRALVRYDAHPPDWSESKGPEEFAHWLLHTKQSNWGEYTVSNGPAGRLVVWRVEWGTLSARALARPAGTSVRTNQTCRSRSRGNGRRTRSGLKRKRKRRSGKCCGGGGL